MKYSYHTHSNYSDGKASISEIIAYAKKLELDEIGISDHFHLSPDGSLIPGDMPLKDLNKYISEILSYSKNKHPIVKLGLEVDFVPKTINELDKILSKNPFDYIIGSIHMVKSSLLNDNILIIDQFPDKVPSNFCTEIMQKYWILIREMAESRRFDIVAHLDLIKKFGYKPKIDLSNEIDLALKAIKDADMTIELNTSGWVMPCKEQYPSVELLKKSKKLDIPIIVTSDAHKPEHIIREFDKAIKLLKKIGYSKQAYFIKRKRFFTPFT